MNYVKHLNLFGVDAKQIPCITGEGAPTTATEGAVGCLYMDTQTGEVYKCTAENGGAYTWAAFAGGAGAFGCVWSTAEKCNFNTNDKTFTIPSYSRVICGDSVVETGITDWRGLILDLSETARGYVTFNKATLAFEVKPYTTTKFATDEIPICAYSNYGEDYVASISEITVNKSTKIIDASVKEEKIADGAVGTSKIADGAVTLAKRTVAGSFAVLWNSYAYPEFNTTAKTFTIPGYSRIMLGTTVYVNGMTDGAGVTLDLSATPHGYICYDTKTYAFTVYPYTQTTGVPETSVLFASYAEYGKYVHMASSYKIDGNLYGIKMNGGGTIDDGAVTTSKIANAAVTTEKSTVAGRNALLFNTWAYPEFNTTAKTLTIPQYSRIMCGKTVYADVGATTWQGVVIDLSAAQHGYVTFNPTSKAWKAYPYTTATFTENELIMFAYTNYGEIVNSPSAYKVDGNLFGISTDNELEIPDGFITKDMLAPKLMQNQLGRCPRYTFTDMSAIGIQGWSDICFIGDNLWLFFPSTDEEHNATDGTIQVVNKETLETIKTINHNFGHVNTCDYCKDTDCLIVGNLPGNSTYPAALYIFYNVSEWANSTSLDFATVDKTIVDMCSAFPSATAAACSWGETNFAYNNIAYVSFGYDKQFTKIVLGMGTNRLANGTYTAADSDKFNGTYKVLLTSDFAPMGSGDEVIQGATFYKGQMLTANGDEWTARASLWGFDINGNIQRELLEFPIYNANGEKNSQYKCYTEGIAVDEETGYIYQGIFSGQLYAIRFYLIKYKI